MKFKGIWWLNILADWIIPITPLDCFSFTILQVLQYILFLCSHICEHTVPCLYDIYSITYYTLIQDSITSVVTFFVFVFFPLFFFLFLQLFLNVYIEFGFSGIFFNYKTFFWSLKRRVKRNLVLSFMLSTLDSIRA